MGKKHSARETEKKWSNGKTKVESYKFNHNTLLKKEWSMMSNTGVRSE